MKRLISITATDTPQPEISEDVLTKLLEDANRDIPYFMASDEAKFKKLAREYIQSKLVTKYGYEEDYVQDKSVIRQIQKFIRDQQGMLW